MRWYVLGWGFVVVASVIVLGVYGSQTNSYLDKIIVDTENSQSTTGDQATLVPQATALADDTPTQVAIEQLIDANDPTLGNPEAELIIVEFSDFQCPFCKASFPIIREFVAKHQDDVFFIYKDFPIEDIHPLATKLAEAGQCAHEQELFWPLHDSLFQNQDDVESVEDVYVLAQRVGIDVSDLRTCVESGAQAQEVQQDLQIGALNGAIGTPTFFVNGHRLTGVVPLSTWEQILQVVTSN